MAPEWLPNRIRSVKQILLALGRIWARHEWAPHFSIDKNSTLSSTGSQTLRTQWFGDTFAIPLDKSNTFRASRLSGTTNTVLSEEASSKMLDIDFARQNKYFQRSTNSLTFFCSTKQVLQAPLYSQTSRKPTFERWLFSLDETRSSSAFSFSSTTNTVVSASWCISLDKYNTFGYGEGSAGGFRVPKPLRVPCQTFFHELLAR